MKKDIKVNNIFKTIVKYLVIYIIMLLIFCLAMIATYALPNKRIQGHIAESKELLLKQNSNPLFGEYIEGAKLDDSTDLLIMNTAMNKGKTSDESILVRAFENSRYTTEEGNQYISLEKTIDDNNLYNNQEYSRYWHGIQTIIRPLLLFFNYEEIRFLFMIVMFLLLLIASMYLNRNLGCLHAFSLAMAMLLVCFFIVPASLQYVGVFAITLITTIIVNIMYERNKERYYPYLFFIVGGFTTFFDLLTVPLLTLGIPLIVVVLLINKKKKNIKKSLITIIKLSLLWCISYATIFFAKWVIASIVLHRDVITVAIKNIIFRANGNEEYPVTRLGAIKENLKFIYNSVLAVICFITCIICAIKLIIYRKRIKEFKYLIPVLFISLYPYIWYFVFAGHSTIHAFFTYRLQAITIFGILCSIAELNRQNIEKGKK